jgi:hypothetical protein
VSVRAIQTAARVLIWVAFFMLVCFAFVACGDRGATTSGKQKTLLVEVVNRHQWPMEVGVWTDLGLAAGLPSYYYNSHHGNQVIAPGTSGHWRIRPGEKVSRVAVIIDPSTPNWWAITYEKTRDFPTYYLKVTP